MGRQLAAIGILAVTSVVCLRVCAAQAAYFERSEAQAERSLRGEFQGSSVPLLRRSTTLSPEEVASALMSIEPLNANGKLILERRPDGLRAAGTGWRLQVFGDGSAAEFVNFAAVERSHALGTDPARATSPDQLERAGQEFIDRELSKVIVLGQGERLVPELSAARMEGGVGRDGKDPTSRLVAQRIVFTREIDGVPVVGAGSKVTVTFGMDGSLESFRYDWPRYDRTDQVQTAMAPREILQRVRRVNFARVGVAQDQKVEPVPPDAKAPVELGSRMTLQRLACGYYDPGVSAGDARAPIQLGCYYHVVHTQGEGDYLTTTGLSGAVPASEQFETDERWPESVLLSGGRLPSPVPPPGSAEQPSDVRPPR